MVLRDAEDREVRIALDSIEAQRDGRSLMADGLADPLTRVELVDLVRFLSELGKVGDFSISKQRIVRRWRALVWTQEGHRRLNRTSYDTAATDDPALTWMPAYSRVSGDLPIGELPKFVTHRNNPPTTFLRFDVEVTTPGKVTMALGNIKGVRFWLDSQPTPLDEFTELELPKGRRTFSFSVDRTARSSLRVVLDDAKDSQASWQIASGK